MLPLRRQARLSTLDALQVQEHSIFSRPLSYSTRASFNVDRRQSNAGNDHALRHRHRHLRAPAAESGQSCTTNLRFINRRLNTDIGLQAMHAGVIRDMEQQKIKRERQLDFEMQRQLEEEYRKVQNVTDGEKR